MNWYRHLDDHFQWTDRHCKAEFLINPVFVLMIFRLSEFEGHSYALKALPASITFQRFCQKSHSIQSMSSFLNAGKGAPKDSLYRIERNLIMKWALSSGSLRWIRGGPGTSNSFKALLNLIVSDPVFEFVSRKCEIPQLSKRFLTTPRFL